MDGSQFYSREARPSSSVKRTYPDLRDHLLNLEGKGLLRRVTRPIDKDSEIHPLVRWQYRGGIRPQDRKAWLFEKPVDSRGKTYDIPVAIAALAANEGVYLTGLGVDEVGELGPKWAHAMNNRIDPVVVDEGPCQEVVRQGDELDAEGMGVDEIPVPISTPGFDNAPYSTCSHWFSVDLETGVQNIGNYRGQMKQRRKVGVFPCGLGQDIYVHWEKARAMGRSLPVALVLGGPPAVSYAAVQKMPYGIDELSVAGGLVREPIRVVKCKTVPLVVPAEAEIVIEGYINTDYYEPEGPFGESHGYMHPRQLNPYMEVTAITRRRDAIFVGFISQVTPSESSMIKKLGYEPLFLNFLRNTLSIKSVTKVTMHEPLTNLRKLIVIHFDKSRNESQVWRALHAASAFNQGVGKIIVAVDEDIDGNDAAAVMWAMSYRMKPHKDVEIIGHREKGHAPPFLGASDSRDVATHSDPADDSAMLVDATLKEPFPPISLPAKKYMERAREIWEELGLPELRPEAPWFGYSLGQWDEELEREAELAVQGRYFETGDKLEALRVPVEELGK
ncbi:MAG: UbiD family decarboxylase [Thermoleophilia bacterium]